MSSDSEKQIKGKCFVVTGAASSIGALIGEYFLEEGAKTLIIFDVDESEGKKTVDKLSKKFKDSKVHFIKCDVTDDGQLSEALDEAIKLGGKIDVLVNNAGMMTEQNYMTMIDLNVKGTVNASYKALKHMRVDEGGHGGTILNVSSVLGGIVSPSLPSYQATKAAIIMFSSSIGLPEYYLRTKVRVLNIAYGPTDTNLLQRMGTIGVDPLMNMTLAGHKCYMQKPESAAKGTIDAFKRANSGTTWCVINDEPVVERTEMVSKGFDLFFPPKSMNVLD